MKSNFFTRLIFCVFSFLIFPLHAKPLIIMDAGSSGTRIYVYEAEAGQAKQLHSYRIKPGLSSLDPTDTKAFDQYFYLLLLSTEGALLPDARANTPIHLYATAGMRMLPLDEQEAIFAATLASLNKQAKILGFSDATDVRTISGTEEGVFIWTADNYLNGNLNKDELSTQNTVAALEMGGASSEIAYLSMRSEQHTLPLQHKDKTYAIYSYGYDGMGADKAMASMFTAYAAGNADFAACFPVNATHSSGGVQVTGEGDFDRCARAMRVELFDDEQMIACSQEHGKDCSGMGIYQPREVFTNRYLLTSAFYYVFDLFGLADQYIQPDAFYNAGRDFCRMSWDDARAKYPTTPENYLITYCFNAALSKNLFDAWHVNKRDKLKAVATLNDVPVEWPLGAAIMLAPAAP